MASTRKITLWYTIEIDGTITPPNEGAIARKNAWLKDLSQRAVGSRSPLMVANEYRLSNPEVERLNKFFNGPVVEYYGIQNDSLVSGELDPARKKKYREQMLDEILGFDVELINRTQRKRKSTSAFTEVQPWNDMLAEMKETLFDPSGYVMPDSKEFWELAKDVGYEQAKKIKLQKLQSNLRVKLEG